MVVWNDVGSGRCVGVGYKIGRGTNSGGGGINSVSGGGGKLNGEPVGCSGCGKCTGLEGGMVGIGANVGGGVGSFFRIASTLLLLDPPAKRSRLYFCSSSLHRCRHTTKHKTAMVTTIRILHLLSFKNASVLFQKVGCASGFSIRSTGSTVLYIFLK